MYTSPLKNCHLLILAQVEALLEDFERQRANDEDKAAVCDKTSILNFYHLTFDFEVEEQRKYLGGDSDHSILVKGLDFALLEKNKARATLSVEDDDVLEQVYLEASSAPPASKKKTREEYIRELKAMKAKGTVA